VKVKITTFDAQNLQTARVVLQNEARYGPDCLLARWARAVVARAPADAGPEREAQGVLFETEAAA